VALILAVGCGCKTMKDKITVVTVENDIRASLPIGSSKADVIAFLDKRKISHSWDKTGKVLPDGRFVIPDSHTETALIPDVRKEGSLFKIVVGIQIDFKFNDSDSKLVSYSVHEVYTGP
jgi:hypothetical protein